MYSFGDILIISFPFTDGQGSRRRPVMVIKDTYDKDILIAKVTSQLYNTEFDIKLQDWKHAGLISPSVIRIHKIQTLHTSLIFGHIGRLTSTDLKAVSHAFAQLLISL